MSLNYTIERLYPCVFGVIAACAFGLLAPKINEWMLHHSLKMDAAYSPIGSMFAVITGFVGSFYGNIQSMVETRLKRIQNTKILKNFLLQIKSATVSGFWMAIISTPFMILSPSDVGDVYERILISLWVGGSVYCLFTFWRVGSKLFILFENNPPKDMGAH